MRNGQKSNSYPIWWFITIWVLLLLVSIFSVMFCSKAEAHSIHFEEMIHTQCEVVAQGWVIGVGFVFATDCERNDGVPDTFWLIYKDGDLSHVGLHIKPLTQDTAKYILTIKGEEE